MGTLAWFDWLEQQSAFLFVDRMGRFTAYKRGTDPGGQSWEAARIRNGTCYRLPLGRSDTLTLERLQAAAQTLSVAYVTAEPSQAAPAAFKHGGRTAPANAGSPQSLMHTKLYRPRSSSDVIPRARLLERLNAALGGKATLVSAPAGFGKTTLVADWTQTLERPTAWLSLDAHDNEPAVFVSSLVASLQTVFPDAFETTASVLTAPHLPPPHHVATLLINDLTALPQAMVLVLDEYHSIHDQAIHALLEVLITYLPSQVHVVLISRFDPPLPLATWLAKGYLTTVNHADVRFTL